MRRHSDPGPFAKEMARRRAEAEQSAAKALANDDRFATIARGFAPSPDPASLAEIQRKGDLARDAQGARIRAQMQKEEH